MRAMDTTCATARIARCHAPRPRPRGARRWPRSGKCSRIAAMLPRCSTRRRVADARSVPPTSGPAPTTRISCRAATTCARTIRRGRPISASPTCSGRSCAWDSTGSVWRTFASTVGTSSGRVARLRLSGMRPDVIAGDQFRQAVGAVNLKSTAFTVEKRGERAAFYRPGIRTRGRDVRHRRRPPRDARRNRPRHPGPVLSGPRADAVVGDDDTSRSADCRAVAAVRDGDLVTPKRHGARWTSSRHVPAASPSWCRDRPRSRRPRLNASLLARTKSWRERLGHPFFR